MLLRQTILYLPAQIVAPLSQVVAAIVWTHWLAPAPYGLLTFLIAGQELVFLVSISWWTHYTMRYIGGFGPTARRNFAGSEAPVFVIGALLQVAGTFLILAVLHEAITPEITLAAIAYVTTRSLLTHLGERARAQANIAIYSLGQIAGSLIGFVLALAAVVWLAATPANILWAFAIAQAGATLYMWRALGVSRGRRWPPRVVLAAALDYGAPLLLAGGLAWIAQNGIRVVVEHGAGAAALGLIAVGWGLGQRLAATLAMLVVSASFPLAVKSLHRGSQSDAYRQLEVGGVILMGLIIPASIGLCFLAEPFVTLFVARPFRAETIAILPFATAAGAVRNLRMHIADPVFLLIERSRINALINAVDAGLIVVGCAVGLWLSGPQGSVVGAFVATCIATATGLVLAHRLAAFEFPYADGARIVAASLVMSVALLVVPWSALEPPPLARMGLEIAAGALAYGIAILVLYPALRHGARRRLAEARG